MTDAPPVSFTRALRLMGWLALRRQVNRWKSIQLGRKKTVPGARTGTAPKSSGRGVYSFFLIAILLFNGFNLASQGLVRLSNMATNAQRLPGKIAVSTYTYEKLEGAEDGLKNVRDFDAGDQRDKMVSAWEHYVDQLLQSEVSRQSLSEDDEATQVKKWHDAFDREGPAAFAPEFGGDLFAGGQSWPRYPGPDLIYQNTLGLLGLLFIPMFVSLWLGMNNKDLGQVEWSFEWLYNFPVSTRSLLVSRLFVYTIFHPTVWLFISPFLILVFYTGGSGLLSIPLGILATLYLAVLAGSITMLLEVLLRKYLSLSQLKNLQALFTVIGSVSLLLYLASLFSQPLDAFLVAEAKQLPATFAWNPLTIYLLLGSPTTTSSGFLTATILMAVIAVGTATAALFFAEFLIRDGLLRSSGPYQGVRKPQLASAPAQSGWLRGIAANEMTLLRRDRNLMVQVLVTPLIAVVYYLLVNSKLIASATGNFHHAATMAFVIGSYVLMSSAMQVLSRENQTLWQLMTFPRELSSILVEKTRVWAVLALIYAGTILLVLGGLNHHLHLTAIVDTFLALYGVALYAFIAAGIGIMATNPLEKEVRARMRPDMVYLYMILVAMYAVTIYTPSIWSKFAQVVLSTLLAYALWQKVRDVTPYLLDPEEKPARNLGLADGMMAALAFFVLQGLFGFFFSRFPSMPLGMQVVLAYVVAGFLVFISCLSIFASQKIPRIWESIGLSRRAGTEISEDRAPQSSHPERSEGSVPPSALPASSFPDSVWERTCTGDSVASPAPKEDRLPSKLIPLHRVILIGFACGAAAALAGIAYLHIVDLFPQGRIWKQDAETSALLRRGDNPLWLCGLAVIAAPLFEEFIFRGLVFQGLRRTSGPFWAILGSAALFALVHPPFAVIPVFGLGLATALAFQRSGLLLAPILAHATYNACMIFVNS